MISLSDGNVVVDIVMYLFIWLLFYIFAPMTVGLFR